MKTILHKNDYYEYIYSLYSKYRNTKTSNTKSK